MLTTAIKQLGACPDQSALRDYLLGKLPDDTSGQFESHFADCDTCEETLRGLDANDTFSQLVLTATGESCEVDSNDRQLVSQLITELKSENQFRRTDVELEEKASEVTRLFDSVDFSADSANELIGVFGDYDIESLIGVGSTGVVFRANDRNLNRTVALKILRPSLGHAARQRFMAEAKLAAAIEHSNVVTIYQVGEQETGGLHTLAFIAMQWVAGETLEDRFRHVAFLPQEEVSEIASQIAAGLSAAHNKNLIHRDIKPANIWLCDQTNRVIILDFGLARIADDDPHMTNTGMLAGTPNFMSPEQTRGVELDGRSDLFSLGCLMYRSATGKLPFGAGGILATLQAIQNHSPSQPSSLNPHIGDDFSDLVMCLLEKQPANRPENASQLIDALKLPRAKWQFVAAQTKPQLGAKPNSKRHSRSGLVIWVSLAISFALIATFGFMYAPDVVRIATNQGELIIDSKDKNIKIEILSGGKVIKVIDLKTSQAVDIKAGEYSFQVQDDRNGFKVTPNKIVMTRGGKEVVSIEEVVAIDRLKAVDANEPANAQANANEQTTATYDGKNFGEWISILSTERNHQTVNLAINALGELSKDDKKLQKLAINAIRPLVRQYGGIFFDDRNKVDTITRFFTHVPSNEILDFAIEEIKSGTPQSQQQLFWLLSPENIVGHLQSNVEAIETRKTTHRKNLNSRLLEMSKACVNAMETASSEKKIHLATVLQWAIDLAKKPPKLRGGAGGGLFNQIKPLLDDPKLDPAIIKYLSEKMKSTKEAETATYIAIELIRKGVVDKVAIDRIKQSFFDENMPEWIPVIIYHKVLLRESNRHFIPTILKLFYKDSLVEQLVKGAGDQKLNSALMNFREWQSSPATPDSIRIRLIKKLGSFGKDASNAKEWLTEQSTLQVLWAAEAKKALSQIDADAKAATGKKTTSPTKKPVDRKEDSSPSKAIRDPLVKSDTSKTLTYNGNSFVNWLNRLENERKPETIRSGIIGLGVLSENSSENIERSLLVIKKLMEKHGSFWNNRQEADNFVDEFSGFLSYVPPKRSIKFFIDEFPTANLRMQKQFFWFLAPGNIYAFRYFPEPVRFKLRNLYRNQVEDNLEQIVNVVLPKTETDDRDHRRIILQIVDLAVNGEKIQSHDNGTVKYTRRTSGKKNSRVEALLRKAMASTKYADVKFQLAQSLVVFGSSSGATTKILVTELEKGEIDPQDYLEVFVTIKHVDDANKKTLATSLIKTYDNAKLWRVMANRYDSLKSKPYGSTKIDLINQIGSFGADAVDTLPKLDEIATSNSQEALVAKETAIQIRERLELDKAKEGDAFIKFPEAILTNLREKNYSRFIKINFSMTIDAKDVEIITSLVKKKQPVLLSELNAMLADETLESLAGKEVQVSLRKKVLEKCNGILFKDAAPKIKDVLFESYNIQ